MACSSGKPSDQDIEVQLKARALDLEYVSLIEWKKTNAEEFIVNGQQHYRIFYLNAGKIVMRDLVYVPSNFAGLPSIAPASALGFILGRQPGLSPISVGAIALYRGELVFKKTEKGWAFSEIKDQVIGHCPQASTVKECWKANDL